MENLAVVTINKDKSSYPLKVTVMRHLYAVACFIFGFMQAGSFTGTH